MAGESQKVESFMFCFCSDYLGMVNVTIGRGTRLGFHGWLQKTFSKVSQKNHLTPASSVFQRGSLSSWPQEQESNHTCGSQRPVAVQGSPSLPDHALQPKLPQIQVTGAVPLARPCSQSLN